MTVAPVGSDVTNGAVFTTSDADPLVALPQAFVKTQSYDPASPTRADGMERVEAVAPGMLMALRRHWYVGAGEPEPMTENEAAPFSQTSCGDGLDVTSGELCTLSVTEDVVMLPQELVSTQSYDPALAGATGLSVSVAEVAPGMLSPPLRHWKPGNGEPVPAAVKTAVPPSHVVTSTGWVVINGAVLTETIAGEVVTVPQELVITQS